MKTFHIDEPREIGKKRLKVTSKELNMVKDDLTEIAVRKGIRNLIKKEAITIPIEIGDTVLGGKFKNKKIKVKSIGRNEKGDLTINGKAILKVRLKPQPNIFDEGVNDPGIFKAVFLAGGPGSGKSFVASQLFGIPDKINVSAFGLKMVNQDTELENFLQKYYGTADLDNMSDDLFRQITDPSYSAHMGVRTHAKALSKQRLKLYKEGRLGVIIDGTGHKYKDVKDERQDLIDVGYDTFMVFVNTSLEVAQKRNEERPRRLPANVVEKYWTNVQKNMAYFQGLFGNANFLLIDNNATLNPKQAVKKFNMLVKKGIGGFIKRPIKNKIAKNWIEKQKLLKKSTSKQKVRDPMVNTKPSEVKEVKWIKVIRNKKIVKKAVCPDGFKYVPSKKKCVRIPTAQLKKMKKAAKKRAKKMKGKMKLIVKKRMKSMKKRKKTLDK